MMGSDDELPVVRRALPTDVREIASIYNEAILHTTATFDIEPKSINDRHEWLTNRDERHPVYVAELDGRVVAFASLSQWSPRAAYAATAETAIYVDAGFRQRGIGRLLLARLIEQAGVLGFRTLIAQITSESAASERIHRSAGFEQAGLLRRVGEKFDRILDVSIMQLQLERE